VAHPNMPSSSWLSQGNVDYQLAESSRNKPGIFFELRAQILLSRQHRRLGPRSARPRPRRRGRGSGCTVCVVAIEQRPQDAEQRQRRNSRKVVEVEVAAKIYKLLRRRIDHVVVSPP
jgi:hypothetical protein